MEILIPSLQQRLLIFHDNLLNLANFRSRKSAATLQADGIQPELSDIIVAFNVNVGWFVPIACVEEEAVRAVAENGRHDC